MFDTGRIDRPRRTPRQVATPQYSIGNHGFRKIPGGGKSDFARPLGTGFAPCGTAGAFLVDSEHPADGGAIELRGFPESPPTGNADNSEGRAALRGEIKVAGMRHDPDSARIEQLAPLQETDLIYPGFQLRQFGKQTPIHAGQHKTTGRAAAPKIDDGDGVNLVPVTGKIRPVLREIKKSHGGAIRVNRYSRAGFAAVAR